MPQFLESRADIIRLILLLIFKNEKTREYPNKMIFKTAGTKVRNFDKLLIFNVIKLIFNDQ